MWAIWMIIAVAVGGAVSLTTTAVLTVVYFERRRHRRLMEQHRLDRNGSQMHRHHLSVTDVDVSSLPRPAKSFRREYQRPRSESIRFYATVPSQEEIRTFPEGTTTESAVGRTQTQTSEGSHQWLAPSKSGRFKRKKKIAKVSTSLPVVKSPMSAITEATESRRGTPEPVELPAHVTPRMTPEKTMLASVKIVQDSQMSIDSVLVVPGSIGVPHRINHGMVVKSRSISAGSIVPAPPNIPLPPIPDTVPYNVQRQASLGRSQSDTSLHTRSVSAVYQPISKPAKNSFSGFLFELTGDDLVRKTSNISKNGSKSAQSSFRFPQPEFEQDAEETFKTIDASTWNLPKSLRSSRPITPITPTLVSANNSEPGSRSVSMIDYDAIFSAGSSLNNSPTRPYEGPLSRPVSAMSLTSTDMFRLSAIGSKVPESPRTVGHRRQNCVRIKNLTPIDSKKRLSSQLGRLAEAEEDAESILLPSPSRFGQIQGASASDSSLNVSPGPGSDPSLNVGMVKQSHALSLRVKSPGWTSIKDKNRLPRPLPVPCDPIKQDRATPTRISTTTVNTTPASTRQTPTEVPPTILEATRTSGSNTPTSASSSTRLSSPDSPQRRRTQIQGPRNAPPPSLRVRNQTRASSPLRRKSSDTERVNKQHLHQNPYHHQRKPSEADLRKSIAMLRGMVLPEAVSGISQAPPSTASDAVNQSYLPLPTGMIARTPSSRYADSPVIQVPKNRTRSNTVAGHPSERSYHSNNSPPQQRRDLLAVPIGTAIGTPTPATPGKFSYSPSSISIWEDESIRGDSPEPQLPTSTATSTSTAQMQAQRQQTQTQQQQPLFHHRQPSKWETTATITTDHSPSENNPPLQSQSDAQKPNESQSGRYSPVKSRRDHFDQLSNYSRNISTHQYQQQRSNQSSPQAQYAPRSQQKAPAQIQREPLWNLQQNADGDTARAFADRAAVSGLRNESGRTKSLKGEKRIGSNSNSNGSVLRGAGHKPGNDSVRSLPVPVPAGLRITTQLSPQARTTPYTSTHMQATMSTSTLSQEDRGNTRMRSQTISVASRSIGSGFGYQSPSSASSLSLSPNEGIGLGLKFGEKSMAYTVNEIGVGGGMGRAR